MIKEYSSLSLFTLLLLSCAASFVSSSAPPNLLFIIVDDLRTEISHRYGQSEMITPGIAALQEAGITFTRAYTAVTVCSPSRTALLTGMRPDVTRLWTIGPYFRDTAGINVGPSIITLPQILKTNGYNVTGAGKVFHPGTSSGGDINWGGGSVGGDDQPYSWTTDVPPGIDARLTYWECDCWTNGTGQSAKSAGIKGGQGCVTSPACVTCLEKYNATNKVSWVSSQCDEVCYVDTMTGDYIIDVIQNTQQLLPQATFVGFKRPHLGFFVPDWALNTYPVNQTIAKSREPPVSFPLSAWSDNGEIRGYRDVDAFVNQTGPYPGKLYDSKHAELRRAYYAAVTTMDAQVARVWKALEASGQRENTWVIFMADHGWALGEHGNWAKVTLFEDVARVPLIVVPPTGIAGNGFLRNSTVSNYFVNLVDVFPTIAELLNITQPAGQLNGTSFVSLLRQSPTSATGTTLFNASFTQIIRQDPRNNCSAPTISSQGDPNDSDPPINRNNNSDGGSGKEMCAMGLSMRVLSWRYTEWVGFDYVNALPIWSDLRGVELYNHTLTDMIIKNSDDIDNDFDNTAENFNLAGVPSAASIQSTLSAQLHAQWPGRCQ
jgi:iduronate 2-sulfatase